MDGTAAIQNNLQALRRMLAGLFAMAGFSRGGAGCASSSDQEKSPCEGDEEARRPDARRLPQNGEVFLPRHLRLAILRVLRPAESATRRLIIASARGLTVTLAPPRLRKPKPAPAEPFLRRFGIAVTAPLILSRQTMETSDETAASRPSSTPQRGGEVDHQRRDGVGVSSSSTPPRSRGMGASATGGRHRLRTVSLPLFDPPRRLRLTASNRTVPAYAAPRISFPGVTIARHPDVPAPRVPSPDDPIDATRLTQRLATLAAALEDLPAQARRFARLQALRARARRPRRVPPVRPGRPPGGRLARFDPSARRSRNIREVDEVLAHAHALALYALQSPDTS